MNKNQVDLFGTKRLQMTRSIELSIESINTYGPLYDHWCIAFSGGKDSSTVVTLIAWMIASGEVQKPKTLTVVYADTRLELTPLSIAAFNIMDELREMNIDVRVACAPLPDRFLTYILGRGVPPPTNRFR